MEKADDTSRNACHKNMLAGNRKKYKGKESTESGSEVRRRKGWTMNRISNERITSKFWTYLGEVISPL